MKLGFVSAILDGWTFEEMMDTAAGLGYELSLIHISEPTRH